MVIDNLFKKFIVVCLFVNCLVVMCVLNWCLYGGWLDLVREMRWLLLFGLVREFLKMKSVGISGVLLVVVNVVEENFVIIGIKVFN